MSTGLGECHTGAGFVEVLCARRKELGVFQEQLAPLAGVDQVYVGGVERGEHNLTIMTLGQLCDAL